MPTRRVTPSPSVAASVEASSALASEESSVVASCAAGPQPERTTRLPMPATRLEILRKSRRETLSDTYTCVGVAFMVVPFPFV